jgi:Kef-type K+ transport system membrane component KefB
MASGHLLLVMFLMFAGGKLCAEILERLGQPGVLGELAGGIILGPSVLGLVRASEWTMGLAEIGAIFLLFSIGLETAPGQLLEVGGTAVFVATLGVIVPFVLGFFYIRASAHSIGEAIFVGAAMVATSVGITARVLADLGALSTRAARVILAAAVLDDILGLLVLAVVSSLSTGGVHYGALAVVAAEAVGFTLVMVYLASKVIGHFHPHIARLRARNSAFALAAILCLGLSLASIKIGMAAIVGAFMAGLALADHGEKWRLRENFRPLSEFLAPFFFVLLGVQVNLGSLARSGFIGVASVVCLLAVVGKLIGCGLGSLHLGVKDAGRIGIGMIPRGEVGLIVAGVGLTLRMISRELYAVVLLMSIVTTLLAPPLLRLVLPREEPAPAAGAAKDSAGPPGDVRASAGPAKE